MAQSAVRVHPLDMTSPTDKDDGCLDRPSAMDRALDRLLPEGTAPAWFTLWLILVLATVIFGLGALVALAYFAGPVAPSLLTGVGALTAGGSVIAKNRGKR